MKLLTSVLSGVAALGLVAGSAAAADGVLIVEKTTTGTSTDTSQVQIEANHLRAETPGRGQKQVVIFDGAKQVMWTINPEKKTYSEMTKADVDRLGGQVSDAMARMQEQMKNMSPEQRAMMERAMQGRGLPGATAAQKTEYRKTGTDRVGKWACDKYEGYRGNEKVAEVCTVDPKTLGFAVADFNVTREFGEFFKALLPQNADRVFALGNAQAQGYAGIPVRRTLTIANTTTTTELTEVSRQTFPPATFEVPAGYEKEPFAGAGFGRRGGARGQGR